MDGLLVVIGYSCNQQFLYFSWEHTPSKENVSDRWKGKNEIEEEKEKGKLLFDEERVTRTNATVNCDEVMVFDENGNAKRLRVSLKKK